MSKSMNRISVSFLVGFAMLALTLPKVQGQSHPMRARPSMTPRQFHFDRTGINRSQSFFAPTPFGFDPFLRERIRFDPFVRERIRSDPFLRERIRFDPFLRREFAFDPFLRNRFFFDPFLGSGIFGFPASALTPIFFGGLNGF
jgi:hypothetical protein